MSAETGSGIGMGAGVGAEGIASGGVGIGSGGLAGGAGVEGVSIGSGPIGSFGVTGTAELGMPSSFEVGFSEVISSSPSVAGPDTLSISPTPFSMDTSAPRVEAPFQIGNYQTLWSADARSVVSPAPTFGQPFEISASTMSSFPSESPNTDGMFADISSFMNQSPATIEVPHSVFSDIDAFLRNGTDVSSTIDGSETVTERPQDALLSSAEQASLLGLMTRREHVTPAIEASHISENESDVAVKSTSHPVEPKPFLHDLVVEDSKQLGEAIDRSATQGITRIEQVLSSIEAVKEGQDVTSESVSTLPSASISGEDGITESFNAVVPMVTPEEVKADSEQIARVLGIIKDLEQESDVEDAPALAAIAESITSKVATGVMVATPAEAALVSEPAIEEAVLFTNQPQTGGAVDVEVEPETQVAAGTEGARATDVVSLLHEEEEPNKKANPPQLVDEELGQDHIKNQYRTDRIVEAVKEVKEDAEERFAKQGIIIDVTEVVGDAVADRLSYLQTDDDAISEIVPEDEKDGSIAILLHEMRTETFRVNTEYDKALVLSLENTAVKNKVKPPAKKFEIDKVLFIANQHNQQAAA